MDPLKSVGTSSVFKVMQPSADRTQKVTADSTFTIEFCKVIFLKRNKLTEAERMEKH